MTPQIEDHIKAFGNVKRKDIMINNFIGGMFWGIGTVIGASVVVGTLGYILNKLGILSVIGSFFGN